MTSLLILGFSGALIFAGASYDCSRDDVVKDLSTGLSWTKCSLGENISDCSGDPAEYKWEDAISACETLVRSSRSDWRLPNIRELQSIVKIKATIETGDYTAVDGTVFPGMKIVDPGGFLPSSQYWSATTYIIADDQAWYIDFYYGNTTYRPKSDLKFVRCVAGP